ncbi:MAG: flagellar hook-basal body complex protein [Chloroflexi bacterium]|nr:flagellar hook-basal body complex protein [Chloroflexota bacterium]
MRALFSAISGMRSHMTYMDVIGNNIANVNTTSYKTARVIFADVLGQTLREATTPTVGGRGGTNPGQIGLGTSVGGINLNMAQGNLLSTGKGTDLSIQGDGFFVVNDGNFDYFTRDGAFDVDATGTLVNMNTGMKVQGWPATFPGGVYTAPVIPPPSGPQPTSNLVIVRGDGKDGSPASAPTPGVPTLVAFSIGSDGAVTGVYSDGSNQVLAQIAIANVVNPAGLLRAGQNNFRSSLNSGTAFLAAADTPGRGSIISGTLEGSNVDLASEFANIIIAQRGFQANTRVISSADQLLQDLVNIVR